MNRAAVQASGAGPAGLAVACRLGQLARAEGRDPSVCVVEKGATIGAHIVSGAVFDSRALAELFPDHRERGAPLGVAVSAERLDWLRMAQARGRYLGMHMEIISMKEAKELNPLLEESYFVGALFDQDEGSVDPYGVTHAYVICARNRGAEVYTDTWVTRLDQRADGTWDVVTDRDHTIHAEHVVNAGGLWAREVGRMAGIELPVLAMEHHYLITEPMAEVIQIEAAVVRPRTERPSLMMTPAPRKPMPVMMPCAIRVGSSLTNSAVNWTQWAS